MTRVTSFWGECLNDEKYFEINADTSPKNTPRKLLIIAK